LTPENPNVTPGGTSPIQTEGGLGHQLFRGDSRFAAFGRLGVYLGLAAGIWILLLLPVEFLVRRGESPLSNKIFLYSEGAGVLAVLLPVLLLASLERRKPGDYGLALREGFGRLFRQGALAGLAEVTALLGSISLFGGYSFGSFSVHGSALLAWAVFWAVFFLFVGISEEFLFRGYTQYTLARGIGFWPAAVALSLLFGLVHLGNPGEGWIGAVSVFFYGLLTCLSLRRTGSLWFAVGLHATFDFGETFLFSVPNSGFIPQGHLSNATLHGPAWLTGGSVGPEGSIFCFLIMGILGYAIHRLYPAKDSAARSA
jgi:membrane protease YdiL (CAAX protease family)